MNPSVRSRRDACTLVAAMAAFTSIAAAEPTIEVSNPTGDAWVEAPAILALDPAAWGTIKPGVVALEGNEVLPAQADDLDGDKKADELVFLASLRPGEQREYRFRRNPDFQVPDRAHADMYLKGFEGPGWESDRLAFRMYWDERNAIDIFCKRKPTLSLKHYATPGVNYHQDTPWGMDVLKVGTALGTGGFGVYLDGKVCKVSNTERNYRVVVDGPLRAIHEFHYTNWVAGDRRFDLLVRIQMIAGQSFSTAELWLTPLDGKPAPELVTGIVRHPETTPIRDEALGILGRWGLQALGPGETPKGAHLGFGIVADPARIAGIAEDEVNDFVRLRGESKTLPGKADTGASYARYRIHAQWEHEPNGAKSAADYERELRAVARMNPIAAAVAESKQSAP